MCYIYLFYTKKNSISKFKTRRKLTSHLAIENRIFLLDINYYASELGPGIYFIYRNSNELFTIVKQYTKTK